MTSQLDALTEAELTRLVEKFWSKVQKTPGCWLWTGSLSSTGYGNIPVNPPSSKSIGVHRLSYETSIGPIPDGLEIDHLCRVRHCVRPDHLEAVTHAVNLARSNSPAGLNSRKTHCSKGHPYDGDNLRIDPNGQRKCRACHRAWAATPAACPKCGEVVLSGSLAAHRRTQKCAAATTARGCASDHDAEVREKGWPPMAFLRSPKDRSTT